MRSRFLLPMLLAATGIGMALSGASAKGTPFATVKDWDISREVRGQTTTCIMVRGYKDEDDENASSVALSAFPGFLGISLGYQGWSHDKGNRTIVLLIGGKVVDLRSKWEADDTQMSGRLSDKLLPQLRSADNIVLRFKDGDADFKIPAFAEAFDALKQCEKGPDKPAAETPTAEIPPEARIAHYSTGLFFQKALQDCDVATTKKQRADLDAKVAAMRPEMRLIQPLIDAELRKRFEDPKETFCPKPGDGAQFPAVLEQYLTLSPEAFDAETTRRQAEKKAAARPSETRMKVYGMGLIFQKLMASCEIPTTSRQRAEFDAKLATMTPEMAPVAEEIQAKLQPTFARSSAELCAAFRDLAEDTQPITQFSTRTPEDFAAFMDAREAAKSAKAPPASPPDAKL